MRILFLGKIIPDDISDAVAENSKNTLQTAAIELQKKIISGIEDVVGAKVNLINKLPVFSFPKYYKKPFIKTSYFKHNLLQSGYDVNLGFVNICYIKQMFRSFSFKKNVKRWLKECESDGYAVAYTADNEFLRGFKYIKRHSDVKTCLVIADLPEFCDLSTTAGGVMKLYRKYKNHCIYQKLKFVDSFVLLTEQMSERLNVAEKPYVVVEGIATDVFENIKPAAYEDNVKTIFYGGTLHKQFGVMNLLDAFETISDPAYRLVLCGTGDCEGEIRKRVEKDSRIEFLGILPHERILELMAGATVIVNPRQNAGEFTKYSFPSKNLEALSSGVPFVAYKLDGIPDEYDDYINYIKGEKPDALAEKIMEICTMTSGERAELGKKARDFALDKKNRTVQMQKVCDMLGGLK